MYDFKELSLFFIKGTDVFANNTIFNNGRAEPLEPNPISACIISSPAVDSSLFRF